MFSLTVQFYTSQMGEKELSGHESGSSQNLIYRLSTTFSVILLADKPRYKLTNNFSGCKYVKIQQCDDVLCPVNYVHSDMCSEF